MAGILRPNQSGNIVKTSRMTFSHLADAFASAVGGVGFGARRVAPVGMTKRRLPVQKAAFCLRAR
jgi:hypothetical protein